MRTLLQHRFTRYSGTLASILFMLSFVAVPTLQADKTLQTDNPFLPDGYGEKKASAQKPAPKAQKGLINRKLELRGLMRIGSTYTFSFFDRQKQKGFWIGENKTSEFGFRIGRYNSRTKSIPVTWEGQTELLTLISSDNKPVAVKSTTNNKPKPGTNKANAKQAPDPLQNSKKDQSKVIPRRRVILPKKD